VEVAAFELEVLLLEVVLEILQLLLV